MSNLPKNQRRFDVIGNGGNSSEPDPDKIRVLANSRTLDEAGKVLRQEFLMRASLNPGFFGKVLLELEVYEGRIKTVSATSSQTHLGKNLLTDED